MLCTVLHDDVEYPVLFLHLASLRDPKGFGRRQEQFDAASKFRKTLEKAKTGASDTAIIGRNVRADTGRMING